MSEKEKMLAGLEYDPGDEELLILWHHAKDLANQYNNLASADLQAKEELLREMLGRVGKRLWITPPFYVDYGKNIYIGDNCEINMNCIFLDDNRIQIGNNVLIAPNVQIYTAFHANSASKRFCKAEDESSFVFAKTLTAPVIIGDDTWIGGGTIILPGVVIGNNVVIGAGSVVTKDISDNTIAVGNPCKVLRANK